MSDHIEAGSPEVSAPASVDTARATPETYTPEMDDAAGLSTYRELRVAPPDDVAPTRAEPEPTAGSVPVSPDPTKVGDEELSPEDRRLERVLTRITRLEDERKAAQNAVAERDAELAKLRERAKAADEYEADLAKFREDPDVFFRRVKWDAAKIQDYIVNGPSKVDAATSRVESETQELKKRLEKFEAAEAERTRQSREREFKAALPKQLEGKDSDFPFTLSFYDSPDSLADALFNVMADTYRSQNRELTTAEAASVLETTLKTHHERLTRGRQAKTGPATAAKPTTPTLTNTPPAPASKTSPSESDSDDDLLAAATAALRVRRREASAST